MKAYHDKENVYGMCHELKNKRCVWEENLRKRLNLILFLGYSINNRIGKGLSLAFRLAVLPLVLCLVYDFDSYDCNFTDLVSETP